MLRSPCSAESEPARLIVSSGDAPRGDRLGHAGDALADRPQVERAGDQRDAPMAEVEEVLDGRAHPRPMVVADDAGAEVRAGRRGRS